MTGLVIPSILAAALLAFGWLGGSGITLVAAFVPLLYINEQLGRGGGWRCFLWVGLALGLWCGATTWWIWYAAPVGAVAAVVIEVAYFGGMFMLYRLVWRCAPRWVAYATLVAGWIACEYLYTVGELSFPWLTLGNGLANDTHLVQWYEYTGTLGGSLWVLSANVLIWEALRRRSLRWGFGAAAWVAIPVAISLLIYRTEGWPKKGGTAKVTVVQPNIDPYSEKFSRPQQEQTALMLSLVREARCGEDFIVLPETAVEDNLWEGSFQLSQSLASMRELLGEGVWPILRSDLPGPDGRFADDLRGAQIVFGATTYRSYGQGEQVSETARRSNLFDGWYDVYNSALALDTAQVAVHHKAKLVAGAEKIPFWSLTSHLNFLIVDLGGISGQLGSDTLHTVFVSPRGVRSAAAICYESVYGEYFAEFVRRGAQIMFVVTNDGWWHDTPGYRQHFSFARLRAIETRRAIARSANTGISGFISPRGDVIGSLGWDRRGALTASLPVGGKTTFYTRHGDYIGRICAWILLASLLTAIVWRQRRL
ncbi:MAG: apolipoprotein N-acyltransferase [Rikenellaceae bacterium]|jgi:apolipoprotein N-acyltransferase|nr:apolipoprotein N-acyltransferase [Rikenellaceae bacterium]